jgi:DNA-binding transcriptional LysR family regulator
MSLVTGNVQTLYAAVQSNQLDVAIIRAPLPSLPDDLQSRPFASEKTVLALYRQHPLAGSAALTLSSVKDEKWISCATRREWGWSSTSMTPAAGRAFSRTWCKTRPTCPR